MSRAKEYLGTKFNSEKLIDIILPLLIDDIKCVSIYNECFNDISDDMYAISKFNEKFLINTHIYLVGMDELEILKGEIVPGNRKLYFGYSLPELESFRAELSDEYEYIDEIVKNYETTKERMVVGDMGEEAKTEKEKITTEEVIDIREEEYQYALEEAKIKSYDMPSSLILLKAVMGAFIKSSTNEAEVEIITKEHDDLNRLCENTADLIFQTESNLKYLEARATSMEVSKYNSLEYVNIIYDYRNFYAVYKCYEENQFAKSYFLMTNEYNKQTSKIVKELNTNNLSNSFFYGDKQKKTSPPPDTSFWDIMAKDGFFSMKEEDYKNLEAYLMYKPQVISEVTCDKAHILIYGLMWATLTKRSYDESNESFSHQASAILDQMCSQEWKYKMSNQEKLFSNMYSFVKYKDNPFTKMMSDKGFNESQKKSKELRKLVEEKKEDVSDLLNKFMYESYDGKSDTGFYYIFQGLADIAYELSVPLRIRTNITSGASIGNILSELVNACVQGVELQLAGLLFDFIFGFKIPIGDKHYSLNDINNILKTINLIMETSKDGNEMKSLVRQKYAFAIDSDYYRMYEEHGFFAYDKEDLYLGDFDQETIDSLSKYYLKDEDDMTASIVEYLSIRDNVPKGKTKKMNSLIRGMNYYEKVAAFATYKVTTTDKRYGDVVTQYNETIGKNHLTIKYYYDKIVTEANSTSTQTNALPLFLENLMNDIRKNDSELDKFMSDVYAEFNIYKRSAEKNEKILVEYIMKMISDEKIIDWFMKIYPSYEMILNAFGLTNNASIGNLDFLIDEIIQFFNIIIELSFDKWKTSSIEGTQERRIAILEKERYYAIQAVPVALDYIVKNVQSILGQCNIDGKLKFDFIDKNQIKKNIDKIDELSEDLLVKIKNEISDLSPEEKNEYKKKLSKDLVNITDLSEEEVMKILDIIFEQSINNSGIGIKFITDVFKENIKNIF